MQDFSPLLLVHMKPKNQEASVPAEHFRAMIKFSDTKLLDFLVFGSLPTKDN
uniref:Uncharacterized protein n=1 Tax=Manihot esculenta TaxID=3983 RepID=A0A2C9VZ52_MANES